MKIKLRYFHEAHNRRAARFIYITDCKCCKKYKKKLIYMLQLLYLQRCHATAFFIIFMFTY